MVPDLDEVPDLVTDETPTWTLIQASPALLQLIMLNVFTFWQPVTDSLNHDHMPDLPDDVPDLSEDDDVPDLVTYEEYFNDFTEVS